MKKLSNKDIETLEYNIAFLLIVASEMLRDGKDSEEFDFVNESVVTSVSNIIDVLELDTDNVINIVKGYFEHNESIK